MLIGAIAAIFCTVVSPVLAKAPDEGVRIQNSGVRIVSRLANSSSEVQNLSQQGKTLYDAGQYTEAVEVLQKAVADFAAQGDTLKQAITLTNLSLTYQQLGLWSEATAAIENSLKLLPKQSSDSNDRILVLAQALDTKGSLQLALGQPEAALSTWQQAAETYKQAGDAVGVSRSRINSVQALQALGLYRQAEKTLFQLNQTLETTPDSTTKAVGLRSLGNVLRLVGNLEQSRESLQKSLEIAQRLQSPQDISAALFSLGNTTRAQGDTKNALSFYQKADAISSSSITKIQAQLNRLSLLIETNQVQAAQDLWPQIEAQITQLPPSRTAVFTRVNLAESLMKLGDRPASVAQLLATAVQQARSLKDQRATSYALGSLGELYEKNQQWSEAKEVTQQALLTAQSINAADSAYLWQWQLGRILRATKDTQGAIASYSEAVKTLQSLRSDLVAINPDVQFSFRESVEPVYRQLVSLLLAPEKNVESNPDNLAQARTVFESLQEAELVNFFRSECLDAKPVQIDQLDNEAAVLYPIILPDRLEVILRLPGQPLRHYRASIPQAQLEDVLTQLSRTLVTRTSRDFLPLSQQVYDWLLRPVEIDIANSKVKTLVFVLDGSLRNIPMSALHDGKQYLVEKYGVAVTPSLQLLNPQPLKRGELLALTAGITEARSGFPALNNVATELKEIKTEVPTVVLLNQNFTTTTLQNELKSASFPVVHIASHSQFGSNPEQTFILAWDQPINVNQLDTLLRVREQEQTRGAIELLVLSACRTVAGDKRAALGLAGVAVRAGARSTLATLWNVNDEAIVPLMSQFYRELANTSVTKAEALRRAQQTLLKTPEYRHPVDWAAYVLVGNWL